jgi:hypothetical protein
MNLYEINGAVAQLAEMLEEGEIDEQTYADTVASLGGSLAVEEVLKAIRNKQGDIELFKEEAERFTEKKRKAEASVEGLKRLLMDYLNITNQKKLNTGLFCVSKGSCKSASITDESLIPAEYLIEQPAKVDKKAILAALKSGEEVKGAELKESEFLTIR